MTSIIAPAQWIRHKIAIQPTDIGQSYTYGAVELFGAQGAGKIICVDPYSVVLDMAAGSAFDFTSGNIYLGNQTKGCYFAIISYTSFNSDNWLTGGFTWNETVNNGGFQLPIDMENQGLFFGADSSDSTTNSRNVTISFNFCVLDLN